MRGLLSRDSLPISAYQPLDGARPSCQVRETKLSSKKVISQANRSRLATRTHHFHPPQNWPNSGEVLHTSTLCIQSCRLYPVKTSFPSLLPLQTHLS